MEERQRRERLRDLAVFERLHGNPAKTSPALAVKKVLQLLITNLPLFIKQNTSCDCVSVDFTCKCWIL